uniref:NPH3 domain-containing protein n=1 Tax=Kalanchoe fedtschenkoi TaxID=63787 RepID=A0A7N0VDR9_KALFE
MKPVAEKLQLITKCLNAVTMMVCTDPSLFGWPMLLYGSLQSPGGSILWNGINTGARIRSMESDWWFEDISYLSVDLFERLIKTMQMKGIRSENIAGSIMYYGRMHLPGLGRWHGGPSGKNRSVASFSLMPTAVDQKGLIERIEKLLPDKKGKSFCRFILGLLRNALILGVDGACRESLERRVGMQLDLATLDGLLIPMYSDSDTLYDTDCVERIVRHFVTTEPKVKLFSPSTFDTEAQSVDPLRRVSKLLDSYLAEVASDVNLKPDKMRSLIEALPESSRSLHDGLYRALDIYFKEHPWLSDTEKEQLCNLMDYQKLSIDACAHASQNDRLPLRVVLQVLFFEQMQLRSALAGCLRSGVDTENAPLASFSSTIPIDMGGQIVRRDGWVTILRRNQVMKVDLETMRSRVAELEDEFRKMKSEMKKVAKSHSSLSSPRILARGLGCKLVPPLSKMDAIQVLHTPRASLEKARSSGASGIPKHTRHMRNISTG